jgi:hypothetical protein
MRNRVLQPPPRRTRGAGGGTSLGCHLREVAEPGLDPAVAAEAEPTTPGIDGYVHLPNFLIVSAEVPV